MAKSKLLRNGRDAHKVGGFSSVPTDMQQSPAFRSLSASAHRVLLWCFFKNYKSASAVDRPGGRPIFKLTNMEARTSLGMNAQTFSRAKQELADKGFLEWVTRGGLRGVNGVASEFALSGKWKDWVKPPEASKKISTPYGKTLKSVTSA